MNVITMNVQKLLEMYTWYVRQFMNNCVIITEAKNWSLESTPKAEACHTTDFIPSLWPHQFVSLLLWHLWKSLPWFYFNISKIYVFTPVYSFLYYALKHVSIVLHIFKYYINWHYLVGILLTFSSVCIQLKDSFRLIIITMASFFFPWGVGSLSCHAGI